MGVKKACFDYRLAPEHPYPAALDDAVTAYRELLKTYPAKSIALLGDSAGGGLALALLLRLKREGLPQPAAAALYSPWVELTKQGDTQTTLTGVDPVLQYELNLKSPALSYAGGDGSKLADPLVSPLRADFSKGAVGQLPPILIQVGLRDTFLSDCVRLYRKLRDAGQPVDLSPWEGMWHVFEVRRARAIGRRELLRGQPAISAVQKARQSPEAAGLQPTQQPLDSPNLARHSTTRLMVPKPNRNRRPPQAYDVPEARAANAETAAFLRRHLGI
jgi:acetyl esterase/lipase